MISVFHCPTYQHMVHAKRVLHHCATALEAQPSAQCQAAPSQRISCENSRMLLQGCPSHRHLVSWSITLDDYLLPNAKRYSSSLEMRLSTPSIDCSPKKRFSKVSCKKYLMPGDMAQDRLSYSDDKGEKDMEQKLCLEPSVLLNVLREYMPSMTFHRDLWARITRIDLQIWQQRFYGLLQGLHSLLLKIEPVKHLTNALNLAYAIFEYIAIQAGRVINNQIMPRLHYYVISPCIGHVCQYMLKCCYYLERQGRIPYRTQTTRRAECSHDEAVFILARHCQSCQHLCAGQYPSIADALPPKAFLPRERFLMDLPMRQVLRLEIE